MTNNVKLDVDVSFITIKFIETWQVVVNGEIDFNYDCRKGWLKILIPGRVCKIKKLIFDQYEVEVESIEALQRYAFDYYLEHKDQLEKELKASGINGGK